MVMVPTLKNKCTVLLCAVATKQAPDHPINQALFVIDHHHDSDDFIDIHMTVIASVAWRSSY